MAGCMKNIIKIYHPKFSITHNPVIATYQKGSACNCDKHIKLIEFSKYELYVERVNLTKKINE